MMPNFKNILGMVEVRWQSISDLVWPVILTEFAEYGTLAALQRSQTLKIDVKLNLCLDIGLGVQALHDCGIVHGDVCISICM